MSAIGAVTHCPVHSPNPRHGRWRLPGHVHDVWSAISTVSLCSMSDQKLMLQGKELELVSWPRSSTAVSEFQLPQVGDNSRGTAFHAVSSKWGMKPDRGERSRGQLSTIRGSRACTSFVWGDSKVFGGRAARQNGLTALGRVTDVVSASRVSWKS
jgi:hypothetical protein